MMTKDYQLEYGKLFTIYVLPLLWWYMGFIQKDTAWVFALFNLVLLLGVVFYEKCTAQDLGFRTDNLKQGLVPYMLVTLIGGISVIVLGLLLKRPFTFGLEDLLLVAFPVSALQEFSYRGYLIPKLQRLFVKPSSVILVNTILFVLPHLIYPNILFHIPLIAVAGAVFAILYMRYPNLYAIIIAHTLLNFLSGGFGFFV